MLLPAYLLELIGAHKPLTQQQNAFDKVKTVQFPYCR
jgi:hypothetical protein